MYLNNAWYVVGWGRDLADSPIAVKLLGERLVVFRTGDGVAALEDRCPHRHLPLSMGKLCASGIQCGYHGAQFDATGRCVNVPTQRAVPPRAKVRHYPALERWGWLWVWGGETEGADPALLPDFARLTAPGHAAVGATSHVRCGYQALVDNLLDLSHVGFVHTSTIGNQQMGENGELKQVTTDRGVRVTRWVMGTPQPPTTQKLGFFPAEALVDRSQVIEYTTPGSIVIHAGNSLAGSGVREGLQPHALNFYIMNSVTPVDDDNCVYFWAAVRDYAIDSKQIDSVVLNQISQAFEEDRIVLEKQHEVLARRGDDWSVTFQADAGVVQARRKLEQLVREEAATKLMAAE
uniref:aromatic ring-hydroxylating dioxygenase subunit alpha n=1 Tax=uncultured Sphingomonas sp. TaxID=158754 RepID=UPI0035CA2014